MSGGRTQAAALAPSGLTSLIPAQGWIIGPREDVLFFLGTPLLLIALFAVAERFWSLAAMSVFATVLAMGHYLPGMMRAYGDPALFRRFRLRFLLAPVFLITTAVVLAQYEFHAFLLVVVVWGAWHWLMQIYGLVRIYDAKARNFDSMSARLDYALCISWFGVLYWRTDGAAAVLMHFFKAGGRVAPELLHWGVRLWVAATAVVTVLYLVHMVRRIRAGHPPSSLKLTLLGVSFAFYLYAFGYSSSKLIAFALFEGYHDIQYLAIVWVFNRNRASQDPGAGVFTRFLFRQRAPLVLLYVLLCLGFGSYDFVARTLDEGVLARSALGLITGLALLHFYFDGFIWRIREPATRATLEVSGDTAGKTAPRLPSYARHGLLWGAFVAPLLLLGLWEAGGSVDDAAAHRAMLQVRPASHKAHYLLAMALRDAGQRDEALVHCRQARQLRPGYDLYDMLYADLLLARGSLTTAELDEVILCYQNASVTRPNVVNLHLNWANALVQRGQTDAAADRYRAALKLDPNNAQTHFEYAVFLAGQQRFDAAGESCYQAVRRDPNHVEAHSMLATIRMLQNRPGEAFEHFRQALRLEPGRVRVLCNFALALATAEDPTLRDPDQAVRLADKARQLSASPDPAMWSNLATIYSAAGRFDAAMLVAQQAAQWYQAAGQETQAARLTEMVARYREGRP